MSTPRYRAIWRPTMARHVEVIDQRKLPHAMVTLRIADAGAAEAAIRDMTIRGAPLIGAVGAYGLALALDRDATDHGLTVAFDALDRSRPTAVNLRWALERVRSAVQPLAASARADAAWREADALVAEDIAINRAIGERGLELLKAIVPRNGHTINVMTHCNAGALATCGLGTATAPLFLARSNAMPLHVWVSETRPRLQGANLTAWEMAQHDIPYTLCTDAASEALMQRGDVDLILVGADRVARNGDVCNKIGTYGKALAARDNDLPFYVALPSPTIDWRIASGSEIPIENRSADEVLAVSGSDGSQASRRVGIAPDGARAINPAFDLTPARLITGLITERGVASPSRDGLAALFPERAGT